MVWYSISILCWFFVTTACIGPTVQQYNEVVYKIAFSLCSSLLSIRYAQMGRSTQLEIPDKEKRGIERKCNFIIDLRRISYFIVVGPMLHVNQ